MELAARFESGARALSEVLLSRQTLTLLAGFQIVVMGILAECLWQPLDEARSRPRYAIKAEICSHQNAEALVQHDSPA